MITNRKVLDPNIWAVNKSGLKTRQIALIFAAAVSLGFYLLVSQRTFHLGFPLDDAWIHQTYARNFAQSGEWSFIPGQPSAGSTAPLWSGLLAIGYWLGLGPYIWTYFLGWVILSTLSILGSYLFGVLCPERASWKFWVGLFLILEWHLVWAAGSGMETLLFSLIVLLAATWLAAGWQRWILLGTLIGLSVWVRPDGITLLGPAFFVILFGPTSWRERIGAILKVSAGFGLLFAPYLVFNNLVSGAWWPNTFYAKQAEYAIYQQIPIVDRLLSQILLPLVGAGALLIPGFIYFTWVAYRRRLAGGIAMPIWALGYLFLYSWRLPVTYQHGRYIIPMMPVYFIWGISGIGLIVRPLMHRLAFRVVGRAWILSTVGVLLIFWFLGARAYGQDVAFIESEMVNTARWISTHTDSNALIAAHDIGALGFFGNRRLIDLAGLISPDVIPFIRNEPKLKAFLNSQKADYVVVFPGWYPSLVVGAQPVYKSQGVFSPTQGGENMVVYKWLPSP